MRSNIYTAKKAQNSDNLCIAGCRKLNPYAGIIRTGSTGAFSGTVYTTVPPRQLCAALSQCDMECPTQILS